MFWDSRNISNGETYPSTSEHNLSFTMDDGFSNKENDLSMCESNSPIPMVCDGSPDLPCKHMGRLLDQDNNSQDSGYSACESSKFSPKNNRGLPSFGSMASMDSFLDISELERDNEDAGLPGDFGSLISGSLNTKPVSPDMVLMRPPTRRALSMIDSNTPKEKRVRLGLFKQSAELRNFKRPEPPTDLHSPVNVKRSRLVQDDYIPRIEARSIFKRSKSVTEDSIKSALQRSSMQPDLIGDFTKPFSLPLIPGRHQDLKSITSATLKKLMNGEYENAIASFKIIDCRYPYEFDGGHIAGAQNLYTQQQITDELLNVKLMNSLPQSENAKSNIIVFHCEFSSERGPNLSRFLRKIDRSHNKDCYPYLHYPEIYLLDGGYKSFFEQFSDHCAPQQYLPMLHPDQEHNLRYFRSKSKTWNADNKSKSSLRSLSFKRL